MRIGQRKIFAAFSSVFQIPQESGIPTAAQARTALASRPPRPIPVTLARFKAFEVARSGRASAFLHMPLCFHRPDQGVANEPGGKKTGKNVEYDSVDLIAGHAFGDPRVMKIIYNHRAS